MEQSPYELLVDFIFYEPDLIEIYLYRNENRTILCFPSIHTINLLINQLVLINNTVIQKHHYPTEISKQKPQSLNGNLAQRPAII